MDALDGWDPDYQGPELTYVRLADHIASRIERGELRAGARLESERELADMYGVAYMTVRRATALLRERGVLVTVHGRGTFVAEPRREA